MLEPEGRRWGGSAFRAVIDELNEACNHFGVLAGQPLVSDGPGAAAPGARGAAATSRVNWLTGSVRKPC